MNRTKLASLADQSTATSQMLDCWACTISLSSNGLCCFLYLAPECISSTAGSGKRIRRIQGFMRLRNGTVVCTRNRDEGVLVVEAFEALVSHDSSKVASAVFFVYVYIFFGKLSILCCACACCCFTPTLGTVRFSCFLQLYKDMVQHVWQRCCGNCLPASMTFNLLPNTIYSSHSITAPESESILANRSLLRLLGPVFTPATHPATDTALEATQSAIVPLNSRRSNRIALLSPRKQRKTKGKVLVEKLTKSSAPLTKWYRTPGQSWLRPPRTRTTLCCWMLWPSPGMYAVMTFPVDSRTRAVLRSPELGFLGFVMPTLTHTPLSEGALMAESAGDTAWRARCCLRQPCG